VVVDRTEDATANFATITTGARAWIYGQFGRSRKPAVDFDVVHGGSAKAIDQNHGV